MNMNRSLDIHTVLEISTATSLQIKVVKRLDSLQDNGILGNTMLE